MECWSKRGDYRSEMRQSDGERAGTSEREMELETYRDRLRNRERERWSEIYRDEMTEEKWDELCRGIERVIAQYL